MLAAANYLEVSKMSFARPKFFASFRMTDIEDEFGRGAILKRERIEVQGEARNEEFVGKRGERELFDVAAHMEEQATAPLVDCGHAPLYLDCGWGCRVYQ